MPCPLLVEALDHADGDPMLEATVHIYIAVMGDADPSVGERAPRRPSRSWNGPGSSRIPTCWPARCSNAPTTGCCGVERLALDDIDRAMGLLSGAGDSFIARSAQERAERCLYHVGRLAESLALDEAEYRRLVARGQIGLLPPIVQSMSVLELMLGDWPAARRHARECVDLVERGRGGLAGSGGDGSWPGAGLGR